MHFDLRRLDPGQYNAPYHFHRYAEELFLILSGSATLRTPAGLEIVREGDILFFEAGEKTVRISFATIPMNRAPILTCVPTSVMTSANTPIRIKSFLSPNGETFRPSGQYSYFDGENDIDRIWEKL